MAQRLTADQVQFYNKQGHLIFDRPVFAPDKFAALKEHCEARMALWSQVLNRPIELIDRSHFIDPKLNEWLLADEVIDLVEPLIGPDIALFASSFINKLPSAGKRVPWHEDASYWKTLADRVEAVTVWLAIDPSGIDNGCMRVIPATHRQRDRAHRPVSDPEQSVLRQAVDADLFDESTAVDCILDPNHCSLHDPYLIHGSSATAGTRRRCGFQMRYMPTTIRATDHMGHQMYLARGKDRAGNEYGDPTQVNQRWLKDKPEQQLMARACAERESAQ